VRGVSSFGKGNRVSLNPRLALRTPGPWPSVSSSWLQVPPAASVVSAIVYRSCVLPGCLAFVFTSWISVYKPSHRFKPFHLREDPRLLSVAILRSCPDFVSNLAITHLPAGCHRRVDTSFLSRDPLSGWRRGWAELVRDCLHFKWSAVCFPQPRC